MSSASTSCGMQVGRLLVASGCRVLTGGEGGVMEAAQKGARAAAGYREGDSVAVMRHGGGGGAAEVAALRANRWADVRIATGGCAGECRLSRGWAAWKVCCQLH